MIYCFLLEQILRHFYLPLFLKGRLKTSAQRNAAQHFPGGFVMIKKFGYHAVSGQSFLPNDRKTIRSVAPWGRDKESAGENNPPCSTSLPHLDKFHFGNKSKITGQFTSPFKKRLHPHDPPQFRKDIQAQLIKSGIDPGKAAAILRQRLYYFDSLNNFDGSDGEREKSEQNLSTGEVSSFLKTGLYHKRNVDKLAEKIANQLHEHGFTIERMRGGFRYLIAKEGAGFRAKLSVFAPDHNVDAGEAGKLSKPVIYIPGLDLNYQGLKNIKNAAANLTGGRPADLIAANDMAVIFKEALKNPSLKKIFGKPLLIGQSKGAPLAIDAALNNGMASMHVVGLDMGKPVAELMEKARRNDPVNFFYNHMGYTEEGDLNSNAVMQCLSFIAGAKTPSNTFIGPQGRHDGTLISERKLIPTKEADSDDDDRYTVSDENGTQKPPAKSVKEMGRMPSQSPAGGQSVSHMQTGNWQAKVVTSLAHSRGNQHTVDTGFTEARAAQHHKTFDQMKHLMSVANQGRTPSPMHVANANAGFPSTKSDVKLTGGRSRP
jgi:hypothetical protein